jgi:hypothetical protein
MYKTRGAPPNVPRRLRSGARSRDRAIVKANGPFTFAPERHPAAQRRDARSKRDIRRGDAISK